MPFALDKSSFLVRSDGEENGECHFDANSVTLVARFQHVRIILASPALAPCTL